MLELSTPRPVTPGFSAGVQSPGFDPEPNLAAETAVLLAEHMQLVHFHNTPDDL
jgi:hypothetical protein